MKDVTSINIQLTVYFSLNEIQYNQLPSGVTQLVSTVALSVI